MAVLDITFSDIIDCSSKWSSILGFILGAITVILAGSIKKAVSRAQNKAIFNAKAEENMEKVKTANRKFIQDIDNKDRDVTRANLSSLRTGLEIALRSIPEEFQSKGKKIIKQISEQYKSRYYWEDMEWYNVFTSQISRDSLLDTYNEVSNFIDNINNYIEEKNIIQ